MMFDARHPETLQGVGFNNAVWLGFIVLGIAVVIDIIEFIVKRPSARVKLAAIAKESSK